MSVYRTPGVYFEWLDNRPPPLFPLRTDIAAFVGIAERGPVNQPVKVESWAQFVSTFGAHIPQGYLAYAVEGFFANGGVTCWVVRVATTEAQPARLALVWPSAVENEPDDDGWNGLLLTAVSPGIWGCNITAELTPSTLPNHFSLTLRYAGAVSEVWRDVTLLQTEMTSSQNRRDLETLLNHPKTGSMLVTASAIKAERSSEPPPADFPAGWGFYRLDHEDNALQFGLDLTDLSLLRRIGANLAVSAGQAAQGVLVKIRYGRRALTYNQIDADPDGLEGLTVSHFEAALEELTKIDEVSLVAIPDIMPKPRIVVEYKEPQPRCHVLDAEPLAAPPIQPLTFPPAFDEVEIMALQNALILHCQKLKDRMAILDTPVERIQPTAVIGWRNNYDTTYGALYFPWVLVPDPLRLTGLLRPVPPSGHMAGIYARGDRLIGVHKPPANEVLSAAQDVAVPLSEIEHGLLNEHSINAIRSNDGRGVRVLGARMLQRPESEWRYVNVRRLLLMIGEALQEQLQWTVFEPNNITLRTNISRVVSGFLDQLWRRGMLDGATAEEAYHVVCDETTTPPFEADQGRLICEVGVNPPWPAEYVIVRIGKTEGGFEILDV